MDRQDIARQAMFEHSMLNHITGTLRAIMAWEPVGPHGSRKLSSLTFVAQSLERHLTRLMSLEEQDGYMAAALKTAPQLAPQIESLRSEHDGFRTTVHQVVGSLEGLKAGDQASLHAACETLSDLLTRVDSHSHRETALMQEAMLRDVGAAD